MVTVLREEKYWDVLYQSAQGPAKRRNQDSSAVRVTSDGDLVFAVADGHGAPVHARSHVGSRHAVEVFTASGIEFAVRARAAAGSGPGGFRRLWTDAHDRMPRELVLKWRRQVLGTDGESLGEQPRLYESLRPFGTTLIGVVLTDGLFAAWQLGDGDLVVVDDDGSLTQPLTPARPELGDDTESMCSRRAWQLMRVHCALPGDPGRLPRLVALSTDGLSNSFAERDGFVRFVRDVDRRITAEGPAAVDEALQGWLAQAGRYSGDDTTAVVARNRRTLPPHGGREEED
ncbi:protein phosphatase 2C domain-containing protein [Streptomyces sp. NPDC001351]|uniref:protein phosphatase 2C domain-containing protein n=1 Tax=Streptomyces sp. NPDC001351 TaxID=3364564 RepID=UPI003688CDA1